MEPILQVQHLTHTYSVGTPFQRSAVEDMSFDVYDGEFLGICLLYTSDAADE